MTKDEAIDIFCDIRGLQKDRVSHLIHARTQIDTFVALGMIKLDDDPKPQTRALKIISMYLDARSAAGVMTDLDRAGLVLVEKDNAASRATSN
jgi:hypothetical protein